MTPLKASLLFAAACGSFVISMFVASIFLPAQATEARPCDASTVPPPGVSRAADPFPEIVYAGADEIFDVAGLHAYGYADVVNGKLYLWRGLEPDASVCVLDHELTHFPPGNLVH